MNQNKKDLPVSQRNTLTKKDNQLQLIGSNKSIKAIITDRQEPSMASIKKEDPVYFNVMLIGEVGKMLTIAGADLNNEQVKYIADYLINNYWAYKFSDLKLITKRLTETKAYGNLKIQDVIRAINDYSHERDETAVKINIENKPKEIDRLESDDMKRVYEKFKVTPPTQSTRTIPEREKQREAHSRYLIEKFKSK